MPAVSGRVPALTARFTAGLPCQPGSMGSKAISTRDEPEKPTSQGVERAIPAFPVRCWR